MIGLIMNDVEREELVYMLKKEIDELVQELKKEKTNEMVIKSMKERINILLSLYNRLVPPNEAYIYKEGKKV